MNVKQSTINVLYEIVSDCFKMNRWCDRAVSVIGVNFALNNTSEKIHQTIAHYFPKLSDQIGESCLERYNITVEYGATPEGKEDYTSVTEIVKQLELKVIEFQNKYMGAMKVTFTNNDLHVYAELEDLLEDINKVVGQVILLNDKVKFYGEDRLILMDADVDKFWSL